MIIEVAFNRQDTNEEELSQWEAGLRGAILS